MQHHRWSLRFLSQLLPLVLLAASYAGEAAAYGPSSGGGAVIPASMAELSAVTPSAADPSITELILAADTDKLAVGESLALALSGRGEAEPRAGEAIDPAWADWSSSDPAAASVSAGIVTGLAAGSSVITAVYQGLSAAYAVTVTAAAPAWEKEEGDGKLLQAKLDDLTIGYTEGDSETNVTHDLLLPGEVNGVPIGWTSSNPAVVSAEGRVVRPDYLLGDAAVALTASVGFASAEPLQRTFLMNVLKLEETDADRVAYDKEQLRLYYAEPDTADSVTRSFGLLPAGERGSTISYRSGNPAIVADDGTVTSPRNVDATVLFSATIGYNGVTDRKDFVLTVKAADPADVKVAELLPSRDRLDALAGDGQIAIAVTARMTNGEFVDATDLGLWQSADESVAAVSRMGIVRFAGAGETTVRFTYGGITLATEVAVQGASGPAAGDGSVAEPSPAPGPAPPPSAAPPPDAAPSPAASPAASPPPGSVPGSSPSPNPPASPAASPSPGPVPGSGSAPGSSPAPNPPASPEPNPTPGQPSLPAPAPAPSPGPSAAAPVPPPASLPVTGSALPVPAPAPAPAPQPGASPSPAAHAPAPPAEPAARLIGGVVSEDAVLSAIRTSPAICGKTFRDVPAALWSYKAIHTAARLGIAGGYADGAFRPEAGVTRAEFARMLASAFNLPPAAKAEPGFPDARKHWAAEAISALAAKGIVSGYADGTFRPDRPITRAEIVTMLARLAAVQNSGTAPAFADTGHHWAKAAIAAFTDSQIVNGRGGNRFDPDAAASRAEAVVMILRLLNASLQLDLQL